MKCCFVNALVIGSIIGPGCQEQPRRPSAGNEPDPSTAGFFGSTAHSLRLSPEPSFTIGLDDALPLDGVRAAFFQGDHIVIANGGSRQIREYGDPLQDLASWIGLSESGERERRIEIPRAFNVQDISDGKVIVLAKGEFDEDIVEVYSLDPWPTR